MIMTTFSTKAERLHQLEDTSRKFAERTEEHDQNGTFPTENIDALKSIGYPALTAPAAFGGIDAGLLELVEAQELIARYDGSTSLAIGWHVGIVKNLNETRPWEENLYSSVMKDVVENGAVLNNIATEAATGSPTRGGTPGTIAERQDSGWVLNGRKTFATMSPVLDYYIVTAHIPKEEATAYFVVPKEAAGISIINTWDSIAMRATGSHDVVLENVRVPNNHLAQYIVPGNKPAAGWLLHIPACYLGIAQAAADEAARFAASYSPNSINKTISELPNVREKLGRMELKLLQSRHFLHSVALKWDESSAEERQQMKGELGAAKTSIVNEAVEVVDLAMRVAGARSLSASSPLQRHYRDIRAGLHNPPMDDMVIDQLAGRLLDYQPPSS